MNVAILRLSALAAALAALATANPATAADAPSLTINSGQTKTLTDLDAAGITDSNQIHFRGNPATHDTSPARLLWNGERNLPGNRHLTIGDSGGETMPTVSTTWTAAYAGTLIIPDAPTGSTYHPVTVDRVNVGAGSRFTVTGGGTLLTMGQFSLFEGSTADLTNAQIGSGSIQNFGGNLTLRYTKDMALRLNSGSINPFLRLGFGDFTTGSTTTIDIAAGATATLTGATSFIGADPRANPNSTFTKTGAGTLDLQTTGTNLPSASSRIGAFNIHAGAIRIGNAASLGVSLSQVTFRGNAALPDAAAPRIEIKDYDITYTPATANPADHQRLTLGTYDTATSAWTRAVTGGFRVAEGRTLTIDNATNGASPAQGGAVLVGESSRFITDGGGTIVFQNNRANYGGAIHATTGSTVTLANATFTNNTATNSTAGYGGAIYAAPGSTINLAYTASAAITGNTAYTAARGGFAYLNGSTPATLNLHTAPGAQLTIGDTADTAKDTLATTSTASGLTTVINKTGSGTVVINSDTTSLHGTINVNEGALLIRNAGLIYGSDKIRAVNVAPGATFGGSSDYAVIHGSVAAPSNHLKLATGAHLQVGFAGDTYNSAIGLGTLDLTAGGAIFDIDLFASGYNDYIFATTTKLLPTAPKHTFVLSGTFAEGTYTLLVTDFVGIGNDALIASLFKTANIPETLNATLSIGTGVTDYPKALQLTLSANPDIAGLLTWTGATNATWSTHPAATNWTGHTNDGKSTTNTFATGARVRFNSTTGLPSARRTIAVTGTGTAPLAVSDMRVEGDDDYKFTGYGITTRTDAASPALATATGKLTKTGSGTLTLLNGIVASHAVDPNDFTGGIDLEGGTIAIGRALHLGAPLSKLAFLGAVGDTAAPARLAFLPPSPQGGINYSTLDIFDAAGTADHRMVIGYDAATDTWLPREGGFIIGEGKTVVIRNNHITGIGNGGALQIGEGSRFVVEGDGDLGFEGNKALQGGAIYAAAGSRLALKNTRFANNSATYGDGTAPNGGAIYSRAADITLAYTRTPSGLISEGNTASFTSGTARPGGFLYMTGNASIGAARTTFDIAAGATATIGNYANRLTAAIGTDDIASGANAHDYATLIKKGSGTLTLNSNNSGYHGHTSVEAGTLTVNGTLGSRNHTLDIAWGATLKGEGTINGSTTLHAGATIAPGNSPGTLTFENLVLEGGSILQFEAGDKIVITGDLTFSNINAGNQIVLDLSGYSLETPSASLDLLTISGDVGIIGSSLDVSNAFRLTGLAGELTATFDVMNGGVFHLTLAATSVPEPVTTVIFLGGMAAGAAFALRRKRRY